MSPKVFEVRNDDTAVISTQGLYRVVAPRKTKKGKWKQRVIGELLELYEADSIAETYNRSHARRDGKKGELESEHRARVVDYATVFAHCEHQFYADANDGIYRPQDHMYGLIARDVYHKSPNAREEQSASA
jgi:hypothetical protein